MKLQKNLPQRFREGNQSGSSRIVCADIFDHRPASLSTLKLLLSLGPSSRPGFDGARQRSGSEVRSKNGAFQNVANLRGEGRRCEAGVTGICQGCPSERWDIRAPRGLGARSRASGSARPRTRRPPPGRGWSSVTWPWRRNRGGPGKAWGSEPAQVPAAQKLRTTEGGRSHVSIYYREKKKERKILYENLI